MIREPDKSDGLVIAEVRALLSQPWLIDGRRALELIGDLSERLERAQPPSALLAVHLEALVRSMLAYKAGREAGKPKDPAFVKAWLEAAHERLR